MRVRHGASRRSLTPSGVTKLVVQGARLLVAISAAAEREKCDLIAMSTHGHKFLNDVLRGSVANAVRHSSTVPVLLVRGMPRGQGPVQ